ncbi:uncharacterized protein PHACADRAFT_204214 [Phanerochaete carnosa HHB-10118-sp]|uniref:Uncharacterized protein n=1 Tax=Phanerochaete carnosa (strain HHB-10118-sp) TaxID=650164 RepID=K5WNN3_PHACS|nr:uncharacterized protein PHACADRAFT_204214 [Phanerochaete carnosa HHB-10118-sp]EKM61065.1 hypothetical protein PHACADRAFT_204214 [Phanerochaete carnosa HHB-10118-sp]
MDSSNSAPVQAANSSKSEPVIGAVAPALGASGSNVAEASIVGTMISANDDDTAPDKEPVAVTVAQIAAVNVRTVMDAALEEEIDSETTATCSDPSSDETSDGEGIDIDDLLRSVGLEERGPQDKVAAGPPGKYPPRTGPVPVNGDKRKDKGNKKKDKEDKKKDEGNDKKSAPSTGSAPVSSSQK